jgi:predicted transcriptional regulator
MKSKIIKSNFDSFNATIISKLIHGLGVKKALIFLIQIVNQKLQLMFLSDKVRNRQSSTLLKYAQEN